MAPSIRVLIVDDHWVVRTGLRDYLSGEPGLEVVGEAADGREAIDRARELRPDVVVMDLAMPGLGGAEATAAVRAELPQTEVVVLTSLLTDRAVVDAITAGASGYVLKDSQGEELVEAIRSAAGGRVRLDPAAARLLARAVAAPADPDPLSTRELQVLALVAAGLGNKQIAGRLAITEKTVKGHLTNIFQKLHVNSRTQAALHAVRAGLVPADGRGP